MAVNTAVRRIFGFRNWQSIRQIREVYGYDSIEALYGKARKRFLHGMTTHSNETLKVLAAFHREAEEIERNLVP